MESAGDMEKLGEISIIPKCERASQNSKSWSLNPEENPKIQQFIPKSQRKSQTPRGTSKIAAPNRKVHCPIQGESPNPEEILAFLTQILEFLTLIPEFPTRIPEFPQHLLTYSDLERARLLLPPRLTCFSIRCSIRSCISRFWGKKMGFGIGKGFSNPGELPWDGSSVRGTEIFGIWGNLEHGNGTGEFLSYLGRFVPGKMRIRGNFPSQSPQSHFCLGNFQEFPKSWWKWSGSGWEFRFSLAFFFFWSFEIF